MEIVSEKRRLILAVLAAFALAGIVILIRRSDQRGTADARARELPLLKAADLGVQSRFWVRELPVVGFRERSKLLIATDMDSGGSSVVADIQLPQDMAGAEGVRAKLLSSELFAVGLPQTRGSHDRMDPAAPGSDAGVAAQVVIYVQDTIVPTKTAPKDGGPVILAARSCPGRDQALVSVHVDDTHVYFSACEGIHRVPKNGGSVETIESDASPDFYVDDSFVYWTSFDFFRTPKIGGTATLILPGPAPANVIGDAKNLYFVHTFMQKDSSRVESTKIVRMAKGSDVVVPLTELQDHSYGLAQDDEYLYFDTTTPNMDQQIHRVPKSGGNASTIANSKVLWGDVLLVNPRSLTPSGDRLYWANWCGGCAITSVSKSGGRVSAQANVDKGVLDSITIVGDDLYLADNGRVIRVSKDSQAKFPSREVQPSRATTGIAADATSVYYMTRLTNDPVAVDVLVRQAR